MLRVREFQHTATRRWLLFFFKDAPGTGFVSTHSRAKAAAIFEPETDNEKGVSTHSRAEAAAACVVALFDWRAVSTHSRAEAAAIFRHDYLIARHWFQHTAAQRRLQFCYNNGISFSNVSTHSRAEAAAKMINKKKLI